MRVFISWSGQASLVAAVAVKEFIDVVFAGTVTTFVSDQDISAGDRFNEVIAQGLEDAELGLLLVTPDNTRSPWLLFEAGALASRSFRGSAIPILLGLERAALEPPLSQFQNVLGVDRDGFLAICARIRESATINTRSFETLFEAQWPMLNASIRESLDLLGQKTPAKRELGDMVEEILLAVTSLSLASEQDPSRPAATKSRRTITKFKDPESEPGKRILTALGATNGRWGARRLGTTGSITNLWAENHSPSLRQLEAALTEAVAISQSFLVFTADGDFRLDHKLGVIQPLLPIGVDPELPAQPE